MSPAAPVKTLRIDGRDLGARADQTVMDVARDHGIMIPALCAMEGVSVAGACRLCLVEIEGVPKMLPACATRVWEGMHITTSSPRLDAARRTILELLFAERNHVCAVCVSNGHCELQALAASLGVTHVRVPYRSPRLAVDLSHPRFALDHHRCILCARCVRVCDEIEGAHTWDVAGRGADARVITDLAMPWNQASTCTGCGKCVQVCPTGALTERGAAVGEMTKRRSWLPALAAARRSHDHG